MALLHFKKTVKLFFVFWHSAHDDLGAALNMIEVLFSWLSLFVKSTLPDIIMACLFIRHIRLKNRVSVSIYEPITVPAV